MQRRKVKLFLQLIVIVTFFTTIIVYAYSKSKNLISGPTITITSPLNGSTSTSTSIILQGVVTNINSIQLNDRPIFIDEMGNFAEYVLLSRGYNVLRVDAKDKFGRERQKIIELMYSPTI